jgi:hypothetical protein
MMRVLFTHKIMILIMEDVSLIFRNVRTFLTQYPRSEKIIHIIEFLVLIIVTPRKRKKFMTIIL